MKRTAIALIIILLSARESVRAQSPVFPALPQLTVSLTLPVQGTSTCPTLTSGSNCVRNVSGGNAAALQIAINAATCGDTIALAAGSTYSGNFTVPATSCTSNSGWIVVESNALAMLPSSGNRVAPPNTTNMPVISSPNTAPAIAFLPNSNHWRFIGVEVTDSDANSSDIVYWLVGMGFQSDNSTKITAASQLPNQIIFDRCYLLGPSAPSTTRAIYANTQAFALVDSYCDNIVAGSYDAQCVLVTNGTGPFLIQNNFLQATGENIMFGGGDPAITNLVPSDITIIGNLFQKNTAWRGVISDVKNLFELKNAQRVLLDGNVLQDTWDAGQDEAIIERSVNQSGNCSWCVVQDVTNTHNLIQHVPMALVLAPIQGPENTNPALATQRVMFQNNLVLDVNSASWGGTGYGFQVLSESTLPTMHDIVIDHNTLFDNTGFLYLGNGSAVNNVQITNNIADYGTYGIIGGNVGPGSVALTTYLTSFVYKDQVFITSRTGTYPSGTFWSSNLAGVGFTSYSGTDPNLSGNFQLTGSSPYYRAGTDGKDIGVWDWTCLNNDTAAALTGTFVPGPGGCALKAGSQVQAPTDLSAVVH